MNSSFIIRRRAIPVALAVALALISPLARPVAGLADDTAAPGGVARISDIDGSVAIQRGDANAAVDAVLNAPVLPADYVNTGDDSRAEVEFDPGTMVRLGSDVQMRVSHIDANRRELQLAEGTIDVRLLHGPDGQTTIDTPSISVVPRESGSYRITVTHDGQTQVTVRSGRADIETPGGAQPLEPGSTLVAEGPANEPNIQGEAELAMDDFDAFNADRDRVYTQVAAAAPYVNPNLPGAEELPSYGHWETDPEYGNVWIPNDEPATWAPYQDGSWAWEDYYGWTWVAAEPWGWAPYHYGRWYHSPRWGWAWVPVGPAAAVPAWSPALVGFVGFGAAIGAVNIGIGFGFGNIGWVPLAPYEAFHPWWGPHATVFNVTNVDVNIGRVYRNANFNYGVTSISSQRWVAGDFAHRTPMTVAAMRDVHFGAVRGGLPVVPSQANLRFTNRAVPQQLAYHSTASFAGHAAVAPRTSFETQRQTLARSFHTSAPVEHFGATSSVRFAAPAASAEHFAPRTESGPNAWSHFNSGRGTEYGRLGMTNEVRPQAQIHPQAEARPQAEAHPYTAGSGYSSHQAAPSYSHPSYNGGGYARTNESYARPSQSYSRPSYSNGAGSFSRPSNENYARPSFQSRSGASYSRPSYNAGGGAQNYARPSYNRPTYSGGGAPRGQASYARPSGGGGGSRPAPSGGGNRGGNNRDRGGR